ncbi:RNA-binding region-containing protein 3-like [Mya arenaria]|uniref:RNA-binding region-containing protein 3-like n=1 Tax=Mya arenaria TaxID=6604 RepID=UPI0022E09847|nr:RNA-binding region-containing protein 3-like [Mya arenaria]
MEQPQPSLKEEAHTTLLVRHLPAELSRQEKIDLLCHFGAQCARPMGVSGPLKHAAFARFESQDAAEKCIRRLHQMEIFGHRLNVQYAKSDQAINFPSEDDDCKKTKLDEHQDMKIEAKMKKEKEERLNVLEAEDVAFQKMKIPYPRKPTLLYRYPPPTVSTLTNIANALAANPRFYTQVLHLMNKMNIPCPFGPTTPSPPLAMDHALTLNPQGVPQGSKRGHGAMGGARSGEIEEVEMGQDSSEESEIESDGEDQNKMKHPDTYGLTRATSSVKRPRKRMRAVQPEFYVSTRPAVIQTPSDVFDDINKPRPKPITLNIANMDSARNLGSSINMYTDDEELVKKLDGHEDGSDGVKEGNQAGTEQKVKEDTVVVIEGGFGKVEPPKTHTEVKEVNNPEVNYKIVSDEFVTKEAIKSGRLRESQLKEFSVFKNYKEGERTSRLYIKNLTKHTTEQDLVNLFGALIDWSADLAYEAFDVRLMKEGRMKGQAFVTLPDEMSAQRILQECNGYVLKAKPMVIQFARSAKAKVVDKPVQE